VAVPVEALVAAVRDKTASSWAATSEEAPLQTLAVARRVTVVVVAVVKQGAEAPREVVRVERVA
jgi:hypothetical protein